MKASLLALALALLIDLTLGELPNKFHPVLLMGHFIKALSKKWNHGDPKRRFWMGTLMMVLGTLLFSLPFVPLLIFGPRLPWWLLGIILGILLKPTFALKGLLKAGKEVYAALMAGDLEDARRLVAWHLVSRDTSKLSEGQVSSAVIESLSENITDSLVTPLLCFAIGGLPLAWAYRFINTADAMIGYRNEQWEHFGKFAARLDDVLNWLPARLGACTLVLAVYLAEGNGKQAWRTMKTEHSNTPSPNSGWTMAAMAGGLGVKLDKPGAYKIIGGKKLPMVEDIRRSNRIILLCGILNGLLTGGLILVFASLF